MKKNIECKKDESRKFLKGIAAFLFVYTLLFSAVNIKAREQSNSSAASLTPATVFTNSTTITINDNAPASPYPSNIIVSGINTVGTVKLH